MNIILDYVLRINYRNVLVQGGDVKWRHYFVIFNGNISDVVGKRGRIFGVVIFIFNIALRMLAVYLLRFYNGKPLYETIGRIGTPGLCIFGSP